MDLGLTDKYAVIGGASKGLGLACAKALAEEGCRVALIARSRDHLKAAASELPRQSSYRLIEADLSEQAQVQTALEEIRAWGDPDILVCNTGGPPPGTSFEHDDPEWQQACELLLMSAKRMITALIPHMKKQQWGRIIAITSRTVKEPAGNLVLSNVFRSALTAFLKGLSKEVAAEGITVNAVLPGAFFTDRYEQLIAGMAEKQGISRDAMTAQVLKILPQQRFQQPDELGALVAFLASVHASAITGTSIPVDGGTISSLLS